MSKWGFVLLWSCGSRVFPGGFPSLYKYQSDFYPSEVLSYFGSAIFQYCLGGVLSWWGFITAVIVLAIFCRSGVCPCRFISQYFRSTSVFNQANFCSMKVLIFWKFYRVIFSLLSYSRRELVMTMEFCPSRPCPMRYSIVKVEILREFGPIILWENWDQLHSERMGTRYILYPTFSLTLALFIRQSFSWKFLPIKPCRNVFLFLFFYPSVASVTAGLWSRWAVGLLYEQVFSPGGSCSYSVLKGCVSSPCDGTTLTMAGNDLWSPYTTERGVRIQKMR